MRTVLIATKHCFKITGDAMIKNLIFSLIFVMISSTAFALEKMEENELKDATAQLGSVAGGVSSVAPVADPVTIAAGPIGLIADPVAYAFRAKDEYDTTTPVTSVVSIVAKISGDASGVFGGLF
jgi:hypothetical protein